MIKVLLIDDEPLALQQMKQMAEKIPYFEIAGICESAFVFRDACALPKAAYWEAHHYLRDSQSRDCGIFLSEHKPSRWEGAWGHYKPKHQIGGRGSCCLTTTCWRLNAFAGNCLWDYCRIFSLSLLILHALKHSLHSFCLIKGRCAELKKNKFIWTYSIL